MFKKTFYNLKNYASLGRNFLLDVIFPLECISCSTEGLWICDKCFAKIPTKISQDCLFCGKSNLFGNFCTKCRTGFALDGVLVASNYNDKLLSETIKIFKYKFVKELSTPLSGLLIKTVEEILREPEKNYFWHQNEKKIIKNFDKNLIIPVPLHKRRERWRGFNQSRELAIKFSKHFNLELDLTNLRRLKFKQAQANLDKNNRFKNIKNNFEWQGENLKNRNIILIDDVSTSTATLNECALTLKKAGANKVWGLVIAHG